METKIEKINTDVIVFDITDAKLTQMEETFLPMKINGLDDKEGYENVHKARMVCVKERTSLERQRKEYGEQAREWLSHVNGKAKAILERLSPIEEHLRSEEQIVIDERNRIAAEKRRIEEERTNERVEKLNAVKAVYFRSDIEKMTDSEFRIVLAEAAQAFEAEQKRLEEEERRRREEQERLEKQRQEQERKEQEQAEREAKIKAEEERIQKEREEAEKEKRMIRAAELKRRRELMLALGFIYDPVSISWKYRSQFDIETVNYPENEIEGISPDGFDALYKTITAKIKEIKRKEEQERQAERERIQEEAEAKARSDAEERIYKKETERLERERQEKERREREEMLKPDKQKILDYADRLMQIPKPEVQLKEAEKAMEKINHGLSLLYSDILAECDNLK